MPSVTAEWYYQHNRIVLDKHEDLMHSYWKAKPALHVRKRHIHQVSMLAADNAALAYLSQSQSRACQRVSSAKHSKVPLGGWEFAVFIAGCDDAVRGTSGAAALTCTCTPTIHIH